MSEDTQTHQDKMTSESLTQTNTSTQGPVGDKAADSTATTTTRDQDSQNPDHSHDGEEGEWVLEDAEVPEYSSHV
jgi:hypothetical protein